MRINVVVRLVLSSTVFAAALVTGTVVSPTSSVYAPTASAAGQWTGYVLVVADVADEQVAHAQGVATRSLGYLGFDPNAYKATASNGYAPPSGLPTYSSGGSPAYLGLAGGVNAPAGAVSLQGATRVQTAQLLAAWLQAHGGVVALGSYVPPPPTYPLLLAHGISDGASDMAQAEQFAKSTVPSLLNIPNQRGTTLDAYPKDAGVYIDAQTILADAKAAAAAAGVSKVNVFAHSQGGLDARIAAHIDPSLFNSIGMASTPNGGSGLAQSLCSQLHPGFWRGPAQFVGEAGWGQLAIDDYIHRNWGNCDGTQDGLYDLRPSFVKGTINRSFLIRRASTITTSPEPAAISGAALSMIGTTVSSVWAMARYAMTVHSTWRAPQLRFCR